MATFKMTTGAIACLSHTLLLHGSDFFSAMDITGDGYHIIIHDPYQNPSLQVRRPFTDHYEQVSPHFDLCNVSCISAETCSSCERHLLHVSASWLCVGHAKSTTQKHIWDVACYHVRLQDSLSAHSGADL